MTHTPEILAPAGDTQAFLAALAAGADAIYVGLKNFSARMQAANFSIKDLARLTELARAKNCRVYAAVNNMLKANELEAAGRLVHRLQRDVGPAGLIVQDLAMLDLARQAGYTGELHLSTLANLSHPAALRTAAALGASRVVLPRELNIDEIKLLDAQRPPELGLEVFVHGALCFCVSGRCYWSSYMGGLSGLRGRCVQPCRRLYAHKNRKERFFSCLDLSLDVLVKALLDAPGVVSWKIEGRKKGPHYVFYAVRAYKMLREAPTDQRVQKEAQAILEKALGRPGTHYGFLPQRPGNPLSKDKETSSGLLAGKITKTPEGKAFFKPRFRLLRNDLLRVGYEDQRWHKVIKVRKDVPKAGRFDLEFGKGRGPNSGASVFLVDRREPELVKLLDGLQKELDALSVPGSADKSSSFRPVLPPPWKPVSGEAKRFMRMTVRRKPEKGRGHGGVSGLWLSPGLVKGLSRTLYPRIWWWLPPVIWPGDEEGTVRVLSRMTRLGARKFVCNAPWQAALFEGREKLQLMAGPFCNIANPLALECLARLGFSMAVVSPELPQETLQALPGQSPLPLGYVGSGFWPVGITRIRSAAVPQGEPVASPQREEFWTWKYGPNFWIYPGWPLDLSEHAADLEQAGYAFRISLEETLPKGMPKPGRTSDFNWSNQLL